MNANLTIDTSQFTHALRQYAQVTRKRTASILNQALYDVLWGAAKVLVQFPAHPHVRRFAIKNYMWTRLSTKIRVHKSLSKLMGQTRFTSRGRTKGRKGNKDQFARVHKLVNWLRKNEPQGRGRWLKGITMRRASGRLAGAAINSVGYLTVPMKDVLYRLLPHVRYKESHREIWGKGQGISLWKQSKAKGFATHAKQADRPAAAFNLRWNIRTNFSLVKGMIDDAFDFSMRNKMRRLEDQARQEMQADADRFKGRRLAA